MPIRPVSSYVLSPKIWIFAIAVILALPALRADQSILLRSGNGVVGGQDAQVRFVRYAVSQDAAPTASDFSTVQSGAFAYVDAPYPTYLTPANFSDPLAQWVGTTNALGGGSALYGIPFKVTDPIIAAATLSLGYSVDNAVHGVYLNGTEISNFVNDGDYHGEYYTMRSDIASLLIPNATNWLYIKTYDYAGYAGLMFSATITTQGSSAGAPTITPNTGGNSGSVSFRIIASGFEAGTSPGATPAHPNPTVTLKGTGATITATNVNVVSPNILTGTFDLTTASASIGTVTVTNWDGTSTALPNSFTVTAGGTALVRVQKIGTPAVGGRDETFYITLTNPGTVDSGPVVATEFVQPWFTFVGSTLPVSSIDTLTYPSGKAYDAFENWELPNIPAGQSTTFSYAATVDPTLPTNQLVQGSVCSIAKSIALAINCNEKAGTCFAGIGEACELGEWPVCAAGVFLCGGFWIGCKQAQGMDCSTAPSNKRDSADPNDLVGPAGFGPSGWFQTPSAAQYSLTFNNLPTATNPATNVYVSNVFDASNLDLNSLAVSAITIGSVNYSPSTNVPLTNQAFGHDIDLRPAQNLIVRVAASLDPTTNKVNASFLSLDPSTGLEPTDPTIGFLPPGAGGTILFTVNPKPSLPTGTAIQSSGSVIFDTNAAINTNTWLNTVDVTAPTSHITALPAFTTNPSLNVSWNGTDVGSGVQSYSVYVSDNGGAYTAWQTNVTTTSATYTGTVGHTYGFYSIATDNVNNVEAAKTSADATVQVVPMIATTTSVTASANPASVGASVTFTASVAPSGGTGVPTGTVTFNDGSTQLGTGTLSASAQATYTTSALSAGTHSITAVYGGDSTFTGSTSTALSEVVNAPSFSISVSPSTLNVTQGQTGQATLTVTPVGGFNSAISLSCSGAPANATCTLSPASITPNGNNTPSTSAISIATNVKTSSALPEDLLRPAKTVLALLLFGIPALGLAGRRRARNQWFLWMLLCVAFAGLAATLTGCSSHGPTTPKGSSTITVTATSGNSTQTATFTLTVN